jgi:hypothetical protein
MWKKLAQKKKLNIENSIISKKNKSKFTNIKHEKLLKFMKRMTA